MFLGTKEILTFFIPDKNRLSGEGKVMPKSVGDLYSSIENKEDIDMARLGLICNKLVQEGVLTYAGNNSGNGLFFNDCYLCLKYNKERTEYGVYDFIVYGFPYLREQFEKSVRPIIIKYDGDILEKEYDIGTYFVTGNNVIITAKHCIPANSLIKITNHKDEIVKIKQICIPKDPNIDIALILCEGNPFEGLKFFQFGRGKVLDEVITMGYPSIPGFDAIQVADNVVIAGQIKSSTGRLIGNEKSYLDGQPYFLINARVKGGNSGGPLINRNGEVIGIIAQLPSESNKIDLMGYGIATQSNALLDFVKIGLTNSSERILIKYVNEDNGFRVSST